MNYQDYINKGFERHQMSDDVEFLNIGFQPYCLTKTIAKNVMIQVYCTELDKGVLWIHINDNESKKILLTPEQLEEMI
jgi:hypothetical protein